MIIITGAAGFIGSALVSYLNEQRYFDLVLVDDFSNSKKDANLKGKTYSHKINRNEFFPWLEENQRMVQFIFHLGARTDTTEMDVAIFDELNLSYSKKMWELCVKYGLPLVYASSAATYGNGEMGYEDDQKKIGNLHPLNPYGDSKQEFDVWALKQKRSPYFWAGLKFFNVYGPNEYHKNRMASVIFHAFNQIKESGKVNLFRSHKPDYENGAQKRDFIYVMDIVKVCYFLMHHRKNSGIYNLGTGEARTFNDLVISTFKAMGKKPDINYIDMPEDIRERYQYYTQASMKKLRSIGYEDDFYSLENGITEYVQEYLTKKRFY